MKNLKEILDLIEGLQNTLGRILVVTELLSKRIDLLERDVICLKEK